MPRGITAQKENGLHAFFGKQNYSSGIIVCTLESEVVMNSPIRLTRERTKTKFLYRNTN